MVTVMKKVMNGENRNLKLGFCCDKCGHGVSKPQFVIALHNYIGMYKVMKNKNI